MGFKIISFCVVLISLTTLTVFTQIRKPIDQNCKITAEELQSISRTLSDTQITLSTSEEAVYTPKNAQEALELVTANQQASSGNIIEVQRQIQITLNKCLNSSTQQSSLTNIKIFIVRFFKSILPLA